MTIINSVIIGSGSGDEVEAYALGDAKNAVKDDKVTLNFSTGILPIKENVEESSTREYFFTGYAKNTEAVFLSTSYAYIFKKNPEGVWSRTSATSFGNNGGHKRCSPFGLLIDLYAGKGLKVVNGYPVSLDYSLAGRSYEPRNRALFSTTGEYCATFSYTGSGYKTVVYYKNSLLQVLGEWSSSSNTSYPLFFFANKDGVEYLFVGTSASASVHTPFTYRLTPTGVEYLGRFSVSRPNGEHFAINATASVGDLLVTSSDSENTTLSTLGMFKSEIDFTQKTVVLKDASKEFTSFKSVLRDSFGFPVGEALNLVPTGDVNIIQYRASCIKYNPSEGTFEPYLPTGNIRDRVFYNADERVAVKTIDNTLGFSLYRLLQPIEQPYVATSFADRSYCFSSGLTGIVKENNNGILKVSTVEDPNIAPPTVPDEAGLETAINYGGDYVVNGITVQGVSKEAGGGYKMVSGTSYVYTPNPLLNKDYSSFEIVMPMKTTDSSVQHLINFGNLCLLVYKGSTTSLRFRLRPASASNYTDYNTTVDLTKKYWVKLTYDSSVGYTLLGSSDGASYKTLITVSNKEKPYSMIDNLDFSGQTTTLYFDEAYMNVDGVRVWEGTKLNFGSVGVSYGYFRNTLTKPSDKYVPYEGGTLTEDSIRGGKATSMNIILGRSADMGSWTSDTEGYLSAQDSVVLGVNKKLSTPVYLWHDYSYISPAVPETIEPDVMTGGSDLVVVGSPVISSGIASGFSADNYITTSEAVGSTNNATYKVRFRVDAIGLKGPIMHYEGLFGLNIDESGKLYDWNWSNSAAVNICTTTAGHTYTASVNINGTTRSWTVTDETTGETFTNSLTDSTTIASSTITLTYGRSSSPTATTYFNGSIYLEGCSASIGGTTVWTAITAGAISLPVSWKTLDGVVYEYPNGFPKTQASVLLDDNAVREGSNNIYVTRTGDSCGLVISTSPYGVDSSAAIGTVELDANGAITSYTPIDATPAPTTIYINNRDVSDQVEVVRLPDGSGYAAKVPNAVTYRRYEVDSHSSDAVYWGVGIDPSDIRMERIGEEVSFSEPSVASPYLYVVNSDSLNGVRRPYEGGLHISDNNYAPAA